MFSDPRQNVSYFGLTEGMRAADFGAGSGAYALAMAERVGASGTVYAVDIQKELVERLAHEAEAAHRDNLKFFWGDVEKVGGSKLPDGAADLVLLSNILFQADAKYSLVLEAKRVLKPGGRAAVIDWHPPAGGFGNLGPPPERVLKPDAVKQIFAQAGFQFKTDFPAGAHHYGLIFELPAES